MTVYVLAATVQAWHTDGTPYTWVLQRAYANVHDALRMAEGMGDGVLDYDIRTEELA